MPLDDALVEEATKAYSRAALVVEPFRMRLWEEYGLTITQLRLLRMIGEPGTAALGELAEQLGITAATLSGLVDRLVKHGVVERRPDAGDRRVVRVSLTPEGERISRDIEITGRALLREVFEEMGAEATRRLAEDLTVFSAAFEQVGLDRDESAGQARGGGARRAAPITTEGPEGGLVKGQILRPPPHLPSTPLGSG